jgi:hypothetical protein
MAHLVSYRNRIGKYGSYSSAAMSPSSSTGSYAKIFGVSLAALWTACLLLNAASQSRRMCQQSDRGFRDTSVNSVSAPQRIVPASGNGSLAAPFGMNGSKVCAMDEDGY